MKPVTVSTTINRPREEIHAVLDDLMNHESFTDHFLTDFQRTETGIRVKGKGGGGWMNITPVESTPERIVEEAGAAAAAVATRRASTSSSRRTAPPWCASPTRSSPPDSATASPPRSSAPTCAQGRAERLKEQMEAR